MDEQKKDAEERASKQEQKSDAVRAALEAQLKSQMSEAFAAINATNAASEIRTIKAEKREQELEAIIESEKASHGVTTKNLNVTESALADIEMRLRRSEAEAGERLRRTEAEAFQAAEIAKTKIEYHINEETEAVAAKHTADALAAALRKRAEELASALDAEKANLGRANARETSLRQENSELEALRKRQADEDAARLAASETLSTTRASELQTERVESAEAAAAAKAAADATISELEDAIARLEGRLKNGEMEADEAAAKARADADARALELQESIARLHSELLAQDANAAEVLAFERSGAEARCAGLEEVTASLWSDHETDHMAQATALATSRAQAVALEQQVNDLMAELTAEQQAREAAAQAALDAARAKAEEVRERNKHHFQWDKERTLAFGARHSTTIEGVTRMQVFSHWARAVEVSKLHKLYADGLQKSREEASQARSELERVFAELQEVRSRLHEVERLKDVDVRLEIMARERRVRELVEGAHARLPDLHPEAPMQADRPRPPPLPGVDSLPPPRPQTSLEVQQAARGEVRTPSVERPPRPHTVTEARRYDHSYDGRRHQDEEDWTMRAPHLGGSAREEDWAVRAPPPRERSREEDWTVRAQSQSPRPPPVGPTHPPGRKPAAPPHRKGSRNPRRPLKPQGGLPMQIAVAEDMWVFSNFGSPKSNDFSAQMGQGTMPKSMSRLVALDKLNTARH